MKQKLQYFNRLPFILYDPVDEEEYVKRNKVTHE